MSGINSMPLPRIHSKPLNVGYGAKLKHGNYHSTKLPDMNLVKTSSKAKRDSSNNVIENISDNKILFQHPAIKLVYSYT